MGPRKANLSCHKPGIENLWHTSLSWPPLFLILSSGQVIWSVSFSILTRSVLCYFLACLMLYLACFMLILGLFHVIFFCLLLFFCPMLNFVGLACACMLMPAVWMQTPRLIRRVTSRSLISTTSNPSGQPEAPWPPPPPSMQLLWALLSTTLVCRRHREGLKSALELHIFA